MKERKTLKRLMCLLLTVVLSASLLCVPGLAAQSTSGKYSDGSKFSVQRISNPQQSAGQADGLVAGTDRANSYAWSMNQLDDENGHYIYIGTNRNILYAALSSMKVGGGDTSFVDATLDMVTNGEIDTSTKGITLANAVIARYNTDTGEMETYLDTADYNTNYTSPFFCISGFRASMAFKDSIYFNATKTGSSMILRIDSNDQQVPTVAYSKSGGFMRAMCTSTDGNTMYIGGTDINSSDVESGNGSVFSIVVMKSTDGKNFQKIAGYEDFKNYEKEGYFSTGGDVWDMVEYKGEIFMTLMTLKGAMCFRAHQATAAETADGKANAYGWVWEEFAGESESAPYTPGFGNPLNYAASPYIFNGDLYFITFSDAMNAEIYGAVGLFAALDKDNPNINTYFQYLKRMETEMNNETSVFRYTSDGKMQMVVGDKNMCPAGIEYAAIKKAGFNADDYSTTQYNWRAAVYNGRLYIGTFDAYPMYKYLTKLTNGELMGMSAAEASTQLQYAINFIKVLKGEKPTEVAASGTSESRLTNLDLSGYMNQLTSKLSGTQLRSLTDSLTQIQAKLDQQATAASAKAALAAVNAAIKPLAAIRDQLGAAMKLMPASMKENVQTYYDSLDYICKLFGNVNQEGMQTYIRVSNTIAANKNPGFELYATKDGIHYDTITLSGFGDEFNYGLRTLLVADDDLYIGTANPFYGAQLWKLNDSLATAATDNQTGTDSTAPSTGSGVLGSILDSLSSGIKKIIPDRISFFKFSL